MKRIKQLGFTQELEERDRQINKITKNIEFLPNEMKLSVGFLQQATGDQVQHFLNAQGSESLIKVLIRTKLPK